MPCKNIDMILSRVVRNSFFYIDQCRVSLVGLSSCAAEAIGTSFSWPMVLGCLGLQDQAKQLLQDLELVD